MIKLDYVGIYKIFLNLQDPSNDLDVIEDIMDNLEVLEQIANSNDIERFGYAIDDTTLLYMSKMIASAQKLVDIFEPICERFLGISKDERRELLKLLPDFLVSYGIILYKTFGYQIIAEQYSINNDLDLSKVDLPRDLLDEVTADMTRVVDTMRTILVVFKQFGAYFAEYQIADSEDLNDVISELEDRGFGTEAISTLSQEEVESILNGTSI